MPTAMSSRAKNKNTQASTADYVCAHDCLAVRTVQTAPQTATAVARSRGLVSCGKRGNSML